MVLLFMQDHGYGGKIAGFLGGVVVGAFIGEGIIPGGTVPGAFSIGVVGTATDAVGSYFILNKYCNDRIHGGGSRRLPCKGRCRRRRRRGSARRHDLRTPTGGRRRVGRLRAKEVRGTSAARPDDAAYAIASAIAALRWSAVPKQGN